MQSDVEFSQVDISIKQIEVSIYVIDPTREMVIIFAHA